MEFKSSKRLVAKRRLIANWLLALTVNGALLVVFSAGVSGQNLLDRDWPANYQLKGAKSFTLPEIGACQGVSIINRKIYFYGDRYDVTPRRGEIHEYTLAMKPTGRRLVLNRGNKPIMTHPTGIAYLDKNHVFVGNTVNQQARIYLIDWERAWRDGNLDNAIRNEVLDDLAVNGCRPIALSAFGKRFVATADYGAVKNEVRLYDPTRLSTAKQTSQSDVLVKRFPVGAFNQNLDWDSEKGMLVGIQNVVAGLGWRLQFVQLDSMFHADPQQSGKNEEWVFPAHTELEGCRILPDGKWIYVTAHRAQNVWIGTPEKIKSFTSKAGWGLPFRKE